VHDFDVGGGAEHFHHEVPRGAVPRGREIELSRLRLREFDQAAHVGHRQRRVANEQRGVFADQRDRREVALKTELLVRERRDDQA
jgi:hypothetical protein